MEKSSVKQDQDEIIIKCGLEEMSKAFFKDYEIIWHDPNVNSQENQQYMTQLETLCKVKTFTEWKHAEDYIKTAKTVCHVITSGTNGELFVKEIFSSQNVPEILTFCRDEIYHSAWAKSYAKVLCTATRVEDVISQIQTNLMEWHKETSSLKFDLPAFAPIFDDWDKSQMNYLHFYLKAIPNFENRAEAKNDLLNLSKKIYSDAKNKKFIADFEKTYNEYNKEVILKWYTQQSFLYKVINNCLRIATSDSIQWSRFLLKDIERAIKDQYQTKSKNFCGLLYRAAYLSAKEWGSLKTNVSREIEMHGFLSASKEKSIAIKFMGVDPTQKVFITIIVPKGPVEEEQGFAEIEDFSQFAKEKEVLFNVRSRFTVLETEDEHSKDSPYRHLVLLYGAQGLRKFMTLHNPVQQVYIENTESVLCSRCQVPTSKMSENILFMSLRDVTKQIYSCRKCLDENTAAPFLCVPVTEKVHKSSVKGYLFRDSSHTQIPFYGYKCSKCRTKNQKRYFVCTDCGESEKRWCENCLGKTLTCMEMGHSIILENFPFSFWCGKMSENEINHLKFQDDIVAKNSNLFQQGKMFIETHEYEKAIEFYNRRIRQNASKCRKQERRAYNDLGSIYFKKGEYDMALEHFSKCLKICISIHGKNSPNVAASYNNIGAIFDKQGEYMKALKCYSKSLEIKKSRYGENHPNVADSYNNIGAIYEKQGEYMKAREYYSKSLENVKSFSVENHPNVAASYNNMGMIYDKQGEYMKALEYFLKSLEIKKSFYGENHPNVADSYNNIGLIYDEQGKYIEALEYHSKSLNIWKSFYGENHPNVAAYYHNIGAIYGKQGEYMKALEYCSKSLEIKKSFYGENHQNVADSYNNIGLIALKQGDYIKALEYFSNCLKICISIHGKNHPETIKIHDVICEIAAMNPNKKDNS